MEDLNWWLMALAFVLGLLLTLAMMIRRVTREVPVTHTLAKAAVAGAAGATPERGKFDKVEQVHQQVHQHVEKRVEQVHQHVEKRAEQVSEHVEQVAKKAEDIHNTIQGRDVLEVVPYGQGSIRVTRRVVGPAGYTVKGDKDTGRYFTVDSPEYETIEAEVWFSNEASAEKAGFLRWDADSGKAATLVGAGSAAVITEVHSVVETVPATADGPYGMGSARAAADGSGPAGWLVKGNADSGLYHGPDSPYYNQTIAEVWFLDEPTAAAAGFKRWDINLG